MPKKKIQRSSEGVQHGRMLEYIAALTFVTLVLLSLRRPLATVLGVFLSLITVGVAFFSYVILKGRFLKLRARYVLLIVVLAMVAYYATFGIATGDTELLVSLSTALITATSISAVFAVTMYEKISTITIKRKNEFSQEILDINVRLATYPILISVGAVFASILALMFAHSNFRISIFLINATITAVLLTLLTSVALLKEDLLRQLS